jgi:hypothetical protein
VDSFFKVWKIAQEKFGLERKVHVDMDEAYIRIYENGNVVVRADGDSEDLEHLYIQAASRLANWMQLRENT